VDRSWIAGIYNSGWSAKGAAMIAIVFLIFAFIGFLVFAVGTISPLGKTPHKWTEAEWQEFILRHSTRED
jgi:hypothetical protein